MLRSCNELIVRLMRLLTRLSGGFELQLGRMSRKQVAKDTIQHLCLFSDFIQLSR